uniref:Carbon starvation protein CstA n=1 Tax=uncultured bacterium 246 TaxID=698384 RepID=E3T6E1_9BACT|nr:carbon starvation protein CstA [uncultured bacterium 246]
MHAAPIMILVLCALALGYRYYSAFLATKVAVLDDTRVTPAIRLNDGHNYHPTSKWVLFGHHFAAISGAGPLVGPVLAAQFGYLPGLLWLVIGVVLAGAVQDFLVLAASIRRNGRSLAEIAREEIGRLAGGTAIAAILFIIFVALAGLGLVVVKALGGEQFTRPDGTVLQIAGSSWGTFTIFCTVPIALFVGLYMYRFRKGRVAEASLIGAALVLFVTWLGSFVPGSAIGPWFELSQRQVTFAIMGYGFLASVLPVWVLLCPRDYLSSFLKIGTVAGLVIGVLLVNPQMQMPALTEFASGGGPVIPGKIFPFVFITIMCGAISGFHALVSSGTTPKMISRESHARSIGYGAMLIEGLVGVVALIAAASLTPGDYFAINTDLKAAPRFEQKLTQLGYIPSELPLYEQETGEQLQGRAGGAVSLAVGIAKIFSGVPWFERLVSFWYHFAIMFEALFILTTIDTGTRIARFLLQEVGGKVWPKFGREDWLPGTLVSSLLVVMGWGYFILTGNIDTIWPMFGIANQLLAVVALAVAGTVMVNAGRARYLWVVIFPMAFVTLTTTSAGYELIQRFMVLAHSPQPSDSFKGYLNVALIIIMMACVAIILVEALRRWFGPAAGSPTRAASENAATA